jgi:hypothetical protein
MSLSIEGRTETIHFDVSNDGLTANGLGTASIGVLATAGRLNEASAGWSLAPMTDDGELPEYLRTSRWLQGIEDAFARREGHDFVAITPPTENDLRAGNPHVALHVVVSRAKFAHAMDALSRVGIGTGSTYWIHWPYAFIELRRRGPSEPGFNDGMTFDEWMGGNGAPVFVRADMDFSIRQRSALSAEEPGSLASRLEGLRAQLTSIRNGVFSVAALVAVLLLLQCAH